MHRHITSAFLFVSLAAGLSACAPSEPGESLDNGDESSDLWGGAVGASCYIDLNCGSGLVCVTLSGDRNACEPEATEASINQLRETNACEGCNLAYTDLGGLSLAEANLASADLTGATLEGTDLTNATLDHAKLSGAWLDHALLTRARFMGSDLGAAWLYGADLTDADLSATFLFGASFSDARVHGADFSFAICNPADKVGVLPDALSCINGLVRCDGNSDVTCTPAPSAE